MAEISARTGWRLADALRRAAPTAARRQGVATYVRTDSDGTAWVRIAGADADTPVTGAVLSECEPGQVVEYRIDGGECSIVGNASAPSVGAAHVADVVGAVIAPVRIATAAARDIADAAKRVADAIDQHFWTDTNGIHVTNATQEEWAASNVGPNLLLNSVGQLFRDGLNNLVAITTEQGARAISFFDGAGNAAGNILAVFGSDGVTLGRSTESHAVLDHHSMQLIDKDGSEYFHVSDLREADGYATLVEVIDNPDDGSYEIPVAFPPRSAGTTSVVIDPDGPDEIAATVVSVQETQDGRGIVTVEEEMQEFIPVQVTYQTDADSAKAFTFGTRASGASVGGGSFAAGRDVTASGTMAQAFGYETIARGESAHAEGMNTSTSGKAGHAEGSQSIATGDYAHGEGLHGWATGQCSHAQNNYTIAASADQTAMGRFNAVDMNGAYALIIGNGTAENTRSNALTVDWSGNVDAAGGAELQDAVTVYSPTIEDNTTYSSNVGGNGLVMRNGSGTFVGQIRAYARSGADRLRGLQIGGYNEAATAYNYLYLMVDATGARKVQVSEVAPWLDMLGLSVSDTAMTINTTNTTSIGSNHVRRSGKVVTVQIIDLKLAAALSNSTTSATLATIPSGYRPSWNAYSAAIRAANIGSSYWRIDSSGNLTLRNQSGASIAAGTAFSGTITYIID